MTLAAGQRARHWREIKGIQQVDLARAIDMPDWKLCRIETGEQEPKASDIESIAAGLGLTMAEFYGEVAS